jgi:hypothetical protein
MKEVEERKMVVGTKKTAKSHALLLHTLSVLCIYYGIQNNF